MDIEKLIRTVPLFDLQDEKNQIFGLFEKYNITWSVKIKTVYRMLKNALAEGRLTSDKTILEASSWNTAISLSYLANLWWIKVEIVLPKSTSVIKKDLIKSYGGSLVEVEWITDDAIVERNKIHSMNPSKYFVPDQYSNYDNIEAHYNLTGPYLFEKLWKLDFLFVGLWTSWTILWTAKFLKEKMPNIKIIAINPLDKIEWLRNFKTTKIHIPFFQQYKYLIDEIVDVNYEFAISNWVKPLLDKWFLVGPSSGATYAVAQKVLENFENKKSVFIAPDWWDFYIQSYIGSGLFDL